MSNAVVWTRRLARALACGLAALILCLAAPSTEAQNPKPAEKPASSAAIREFYGMSAPVGLKVVNLYDNSRNYRLSTTSLGLPYEGNRSRPLQLLIWYPARKTNAAPMTVGNYVHLIASEEVFTAEERIREERSAQTDFSKMLQYRMHAVKDAPMLPGRYPIVIFAPGLDDEAWENAVLCEYLASRGYLVIASASVGTTSRIGEGGISNADTEARDIAFLLGYALGLPDADSQRVAAMGYSYGGLASYFAAARDDRIRALVEIDGTMRYAPEVVAQATDVHAELMGIPLLFIGGAQRPDPADDLSGKAGEDNPLLKWQHGDVYTIWMRQMKHGAFASIDHLPDMDSPERQNPVVGWAWMGRYIREFLDAELKQKYEAQAFMKRELQENGVPEAVMAHSFRPGAGTPPSYDGFRSELGRRGFDQAASLYAELHSEYPGFALQESKLLNLWVYELINGHHPREALGLLDAYNLACPNSSEVYYLAAQTWEEAGDKAKAEENYMKALQIKPDFSPAAEKLRALTMGAEGTKTR